MNDSTQARLGYQLRSQSRKLTGEDQVRNELHYAERRIGQLGGMLADSEAARSDLARLSVSEPLTYRKGGPHSFFYDVARTHRMNNSAASERLARHDREMAAELPKRAQARARAAQLAYENAFYSTPADRRAMDAMLAAGVNPFERETRALSRTDGQGGYFAPPIYLIDQYVQFAREASPFASDWHVIDLPPGTSEINVPRLAMGAGTGPQSDDSPAVSRDVADTLVTAQVRTIAGNADASMQWLDQGQGSGGYGVDDVIFADLTADIAQNIDGQALLGGGTGAQILGVWPAGAIAAANGIVQADANNASSQTWTVASAGASLHVNAAQLVSLARRIRARADGWSWYWHPWTWSLYTAQTDNNGRPLVNDQCGDLPAGAAGYYQNIPVRLDASIPTTFGGTAAPYMGAITNGQYAAVPGSGTGASYTPLLLARPADLFLFPGAVRLQVLREVLSGTGMVRFQAFQYLASMPHRYVSAAAVGSSVSAGGDVAHATLTWQQSNSLLQLSGSGY